MSMIFEVFTVVLLKIQVFWYVTLYGWVNSYWSLKDCSAFISNVKHSLTPKVKLLWSFKTSRIIYPTTLHNIAEDLNLHIRSAKLWIWKKNGMYSKIPLIQLVWDWTGAECWIFRIIRQPLY
jgi:hypothetical protein